MCFMVYASFIVLPELSTLFKEVLLAFIWQNFLFIREQEEEFVITAL